MAAVPRTTTKIPEKKFVVSTGRPVDAVTPKATYTWFDKIKFFFRLYDFLYSLPILFLLYLGVQILQFKMFGAEMEHYPLEVVQPLFMVAFIMVGIANILIILLRLYQKTIFHWLFGKYNCDEKVILNYSKSDFKELTSWQRIKFCYALFGFIFLVAVILYLMFL